MTALPMMPMYWERFFADTGNLSIEQRGVYALMLGKMWLNHGWLTADDVKLSHQLGVDVRRFRSTYWPALSQYFRQEIDPICGPILRQSRLVAELGKAHDLLEKKKAQTATARAKKAEKSSKASSVTVRPNGSATDAVTTHSNSALPARAEPEPEEPSSLRDDGSGSPLPPPATGRPAQPLKAADRPVAATVPGHPVASELAGPFVPAAKPPARPITPAGRSSFLERWERHQAGDEHALDPTPGAPRLSEPVGDPGLWDTVNSKFKPERPALAAKEGPADERQPSDDDLDDFIKF